MEILKNLQVIISRLWNLCKSFSLEYGDFCFVPFHPSDYKISSFYLISAKLSRGESADEGSAISLIECFLGICISVVRSELICICRIIDEKIFAEISWLSSGQFFHFGLIVFCLCGKILYLGEMATLFARMALNFA